MSQLVTHVNILPCSTPLFQTNIVHVLVSSGRDFFHFLAGNIDPYCNIVLICLIIISCKLNISGKM